MTLKEYREWLKRELLQSKGLRGQTEYHNGVYDMAFDALLKLDEVVITNEHPTSPDST